MMPDAEKKRSGLEQNRQLGRGKIGASHRFNWSEERATASSVSSIGKHGHLSKGKATHYVYDIFQPHDSLALSGNCGTLCTTLCTKL
jgi:hypothetical protein